MTSASSPGSAEQLFLSHLPLIERAARHACSCRRIPQGEVEDFVSEVKVKLIDHDYAVIRRFEAKGNCSFKTYVVAVIQNFLTDHLHAVLGKRRPSANAKDLGPAAEEYEKLRLHDGLTEHEAQGTLRSRGLELDEKTRLQLEIGLVTRAPRRLRADEEVLQNVAAPNGRGDEHMLAALRAQTQRRILLAIRELRQQLPADEQALLRFRFDDGWLIVDIARRLQVQQKPLYRRFQKIFDWLRKRLEERGFSQDDVKDALVGDDDPGADE